jgi:hypothetical protein
MMKKIVVMAGLIFCLTGVSAEEQKVLIPTHVEPQWPSEHDLCWDKKGGCICKKDLPKFPVTSPKGMKLTSVCGYNSRPKDDFLAGTFHFSGDATVHGKLVSERREGEEGGGDYFLFSGESSLEYSVFSSSIYNLQITTSALSSRKLNYPELSDENNCWSADAVLKIKLLKIVWTEQDDAGNFPLKFDIVKVGKFSKCELR